MMGKRQTGNDRLRQKMHLQTLHIHLSTPFIAIAYNLCIFFINFKRLSKISKFDNSFAMSVRPHETTRLPLDGYS
jgi:hypothetical protein